jgi:hypothetical protein
MSFEILSRYAGAVLYKSDTAQTIAEAVREAVGNGVNLDGASLVGANLNGANLSRASLNGANLSRASLDGANLVGANLDGAYLYGANLNGAYLDGANLSRARLDGANLVGANLVGASLDGANLVGANLDGAYLSRIAITLVGSRHVITAFGRDRVCIGCQQYALDYWLEHFRAIGRANEYPDEAVEEYGILLQTLDRVFAAAECPEPGTAKEAAQDGQ